MISRRRIITQSLQKIDYQNHRDAYEEDIWFNKEKLYKDHIQEVLNKWEQIDDEIWAKIICMERNCRIAKAYAREPVITINESEDGFDGHCIGLNGFDNPMRDSLVEEVKMRIGRGCKIKVDERGNIIIKRNSRCNIYVKGWQNEGSNVSVSKEIIKTNGLLEFQKAVKLFDMKKFEANIKKELRSAYPSRKKLEDQCISCISFAKDEPNILDLPSWIMIINIVALDMLKKKMPKVSTQKTKLPSFLSIFDKQREGVYDDEEVEEEDPYSIPANSSYYGSGYYVRTGTLLKKSLHKEPKPPKLPPRDFGKFKKSKTKSKQPVQIPTPDYSQDEDFYSLGQNTLRKNMISSYEDEDPYYCGMKARVPNHIKPYEEIRIPISTLKREKSKMKKVFSSGYINTLIRPLTKKQRSKSYHYDYNYNTSSESDPYATLNDDYEIYEPIYGRIGGINNFSSGSYFDSTPYEMRRAAYTSAWDYYQTY